MAGSTEPKAGDTKPLTKAGESMGASVSEQNPIDEGLNKVHQPDNSNQDTYTKVESVGLSESGVDPNKPKEEPKVVEKIVEKIVEKEVIKPDPQDKARITELETAVNKLQENVRQQIQKRLKQLIKQEQKVSKK